MRQTIVTLSADVQPRSIGTLRGCIAQLKAAVEAPTGGTDGYDALGLAVPALHFASIMVFEDQHYDPMLTVELNVDGDIGSALVQLQRTRLEPFLRTMVRCCKRPNAARAAALYDGVTVAGSRAPLAPFLETCIVRPAVFHQGNRGLDRSRIQRETDLFTAVQAALATPALYQANDAVGLHQGLRAALLASNPWLGRPAVARWTTRERVADVARLLAFVAAVLLGLSVPGMILVLLMPWWAALAVCLAGALVALATTPGLLGRPRAAPVAALVRPGLPYVPKPTPEFRLVVGAAGVFGVAAYVVLVALAFTILLSPLHLGALSGLFAGALAVTAIGLVTTPLPVAIVLNRLRVQEERDPTQEDPRDDPQALAKILAAEDHIAQNHMGSLVLIKPGVLRAVVLRAGLWGLGLWLRASATDGYLASMRTIHFAHWAILSNGSRLAFFSNFDSSWENYLDDFIEKAHVGLTLAWTNGIGFAPTEFLIDKGATSGRLFKAWARHSMAEGLFWFSAYKDLSVNQIERQYRIAQGLCRPILSREEAQLWACDL